MEREVRENLHRRDAENAERTKTILTSFVLGDLGVSAVNA
jgi:hypothetical protein